MRNTKRGKIAAVAAGIAVALALVPASPASAVSYYSFEGWYSGTCMNVSQTAQTIVDLMPCSSSTQQDFQMIQATNSPSGHARYRLKNRYAGKCLDINGTNAYPAAKSCTGGDDQLWERFDNANDSITWKSWGAWSIRGVHTCLANAVVGETWLTKRTCDATSARQQWSF